MNRLYEQDDLNARNLWPSCKNDLYKPKNLGGNLRTVKHSGQCGAFFISSIKIFAFIHSMLLRKSASVQTVL